MDLLTRMGMLEAERSENPLGEHQPATSGGGWIGLLQALWQNTIPRMRRWRRLRQARRRIEIRCGDIDVEVEEADSGLVKFQMTLINFTRRRWELKHVEIISWRIGRHQLPPQTSHIVAHGAIGPLDVGDGWFSVSLTPAGIRKVMQGMNTAPNLGSTPRLRMLAQVRCVFKSKRRDQRLEVELTGDPISITVPGNLLEN